MHQFYRIRKSKQPQTRANCSFNLMDIMTWYCRLPRLIISITGTHVSKSANFWANVRYACTRLAPTYCASQMARSWQHCHDSRISVNIGNCMGFKFTRCYISSALRLHAFKCDEAAISHHFHQLSKGCGTKFCEIIFTPMYSVSQPDDKKIILQAVWVNYIQ